MKGRIRKLLPLLLLVWMLPLPARAGSTQLTTSVPACVSLTVEITGKGTVRVGNEKTTKTATIPVFRNRDCAVSAKPASGYSLESAFLDGENVTRALSGGSLILEDVRQDAVLTVKFSRKNADTSNPKTGDLGVRYATDTGLLSIAALWLAFRKRKARREKQ